MPHITAEILSADLSAQLNLFVSFLRVNLSPIILASPVGREYYRAAMI
jgi:hypothetical protein